MHMQAVELAARQVQADRGPALFRFFKVGGLRNVQVGRLCITVCLSKKRPSLLAAIDRNVSAEMVLGVFVVALVALTVCMVAVVTGGHIGLPGLGM